MLSVNPDIPTSVELDALGFTVDQAKWIPLTGGRTNKLWRVTGNNGSVVCKLYSEASNNPLFPNDPQDEFSALTLLIDEDIAPIPKSFLETSRGPAILYKYLNGSTAQSDQTPRIARALARLHELPNHRFRSFRKAPVSSLEIIDHGQEILRRCTSDKVARLAEIRPDDPKIKCDSRVFLHGDFVPANIIDVGNELKFIDWQCPAVGDPCEDISTFLSPAMQLLYTQTPITKVQKQAFLDAYPDQETISRYEVLAPLYSWRMAAYCLWQLENGKTDYAKAFELELASISPTCQSNYPGDYHTN